VIFLLYIHGVRRLRLGIGSLLLAVLFGWFGQTPVFAWQLRALYPNPIGDDADEWILLEKDNQVSGLWQIRDGVGKIVEWNIPESSTSGWLKVEKNNSGISLNNTDDWIELWQDDILVELSDAYSNIAEGVVWTKLDDGWFEVSLQEFETKLAENRWWSIPPVSPEPSPVISASPQSLVSPKVTPASFPTGETVPVTVTTIDKNRPVDTPSYQNLQMPKLYSTITSSESAVLGVISDLPDYPLPSQQEETRIFRAWQKKAFVGAFGFLLAGVSFELAAVPSLLRWYNDRQCRW
jgi:hypothetical protein